MFEKILQALKEKRGTTSNVSDRTLEDLAHSYESVITTDEILATVDFTKAIATIDGNINKYTADAVQKVKDEEAVKKAAEEAGKKKGTQQPGPPIYEKVEDERIKALEAQNAKLIEQFSSIEADKLREKRTDRISAILKSTPDFYKKDKLASFQRTSFKDEDDFETYATEVEDSRKAFEQSAKEQGLNNFVPGGANIPRTDGQTPTLASAREILNASKTKD